MNRWKINRTINYATCACLTIRYADSIDVTQTLSARSKDSLIRCLNGMIAALNPCAHALRVQF